MYKKIITAVSINIDETANMQQKIITLKSTSTVTLGDVDRNLSMMRQMQAVFLLLMQEKQKISEKLSFSFGL
ncbi:MAG: hypothetical protein E7506_06400 [Ruminococcus sp.]|nr:hypothetical protein [Ruminococcus sp.]